MSETIEDLCHKVWLAEIEQAYRHRVVDITRQFNRHQRELAALATELQQQKSPYYYKSRKQRNGR